MRIKTTHFATNEQLKECGRLAHVHQRGRVALTPLQNTCIKAGNRMMQWNWDNPEARQISVATGFMPMPESGSHPLIQRAVEHFGAIGFTRDLFETGCG